MKYCLECGKEMEINNPSQNARKFCSISCRRKYYGKRTRISVKRCAYCDKEYVAVHNKHYTKFCSAKCRYYSKLESNYRSVQRYKKKYTNPTGQEWLGNSNLKSHCKPDFNQELQMIKNEFKRLKLKRGGL